MFSDSYKMRLVDDVIYEVYGKTVVRKDDIKIDGANPSAEEADEGTDDTGVSGVDIVLNHRLAETGFSDKKQFTVYLKDYMKKWVRFVCVRSIEVVHVIRVPAINARIKCFETATFL